MNDRRTFFQTFFPRWSGFFAGSCDPKIGPVEALLKLEWLVEGIYRFWTSTSGYSYRYSIDSGKLRLWEVRLKTETYTGFLDAHGSECIIAPQSCTLQGS